MAIAGGASRLNEFGNNSNFNADDRNVDNDSNCLRGIALHELGTLKALERFDYFKRKVSKNNTRKCFLGFRVFFFHKLLKKNNANSLRIKLLKFKEDLINNSVAYDKIYACFEGWFNYTKTANTYKLRLRIAESFEQLFPNEISDIEVNRLLKLC